MITQSIPFGMYGFGQTAGWPQYPISPQLLAYQQDPYGILSRQAWQMQATNPWQTQATNPWVIQALIGELVGAIARQHHMGLGHHVGLGQTPFAQPFPQLAQPVPQFVQPFPQFGSPLQSVIGGLTQGSYSNGAGSLGLGAGLPFAAGVGNWAVPGMAMV